MMNDTVRLPAEWEPTDYILLSWPHQATDWAYMLDDVRTCFREIVRNILPYAKILIVAPDTDSAFELLKPLSLSQNIRFLQMPTNDTWARDFGMICTSNGCDICINDFKFNGWGLKFPANHDNLINTNIIRLAQISPSAKYSNRLNFVLEGGAIDSDGRGSLLTTSFCLLSPNRNGASSKADIELYLKDAFGSNNILWVDHGALEGDDTDSHIDTLARFLPGGVIACTSCDRPDDAHFRPLADMLQQIKSFADVDGNPFSIIELPIPSPIYDEDGMRLPATYANFLFVNGAVLLPIYGDSHYDSIAIRRISEALPDYKIVPIDCSALIQQHGSLHCMTMQIPHGVFV